MKTESRRDMKRTEGLWEWWAQQESGVFRRVSHCGQLSSEFALICSSCCFKQIYRHVHSVIFSIQIKQMQPSASTVSLTWCVFVYRYCIWQVDWSVWSWNVSWTQSSWRSRTSSRVILRKNGYLCSCPQQSSQSDGNTNRRWKSRFWTLTHLIGCLGAEVT